MKGFPLFDVQNIEVIRGPQGTLFGRNTTAGIIKINTRRPDDEFSAYLKGSYSTFNTTNIEGAAGGALIDGTLSARASVLSRSRDNWIRNGADGEKALGRYNENAGRLQLLWTPSDRFSALLSHQNRSLDGTSSIFRANVFDTGSPGLNQNYDRDVVNYDGGDNNPQSYESHGTTLNLSWDFDTASLNSISSYQQADGFSRGDIDGGLASEVPFPSVTQDGADTDQFTQEFRLASISDGPVNWQIGAFFFRSDLVVSTESFASFGFASRQDTKIQQQNTTWALFGQGSYDVNDQLTLTAGVRYTKDEKDFQVLQFGQLWLDLGIPTFMRTRSPWTTTRPAGS